MQRVVRSTLVGLLALAGITACGDKVTLPPPTTIVPTNVVHSVTVTPASLTLSIGQKALLVASVDADAGVTDRTVVWSSSNTAVATVGTDGTVTAVGAGTASIVATAHADPNVKAAAAVTVGAVQNAAVTISSISSNATGQLVNQNAVAGQIDVAINFTPGSQAVSAIQLALNCNAAGGFPASSDTVVAQQILSTGDLAPIGGDAASADIINLSVNTAAFNSGTGAVAFRNGACVLRAKAVTTAGTQVASNTQAITLANTDFLLFGISTTPSTGQLASATSATGQLWNAGAVNVTAVPVIFTAGRSITTGSISLVNAGGDAALGQAGATIAPANPITAAVSSITPASGGNVFSATFPNSTTATSGVGGAVVDTLGVTVSTVDNAGNAGPGATATPINFIRLDNRAPDLTGVAFVANTQNTSGGWVGKNFVFSVGTAATNPINPGNSATDNQVAITAIDPGNTSPAGGGVGRVSDTTLFAPSGSAASAFAAFTNVNNLPETSSASAAGVADDLKLKVCDALGNCATSGVITTFGVDLTPPVLTVVSGPANQTIFGIGAAIATTFSTAVNDPQGANGATGSGPVPGGNTILASESVLVPSGATGQSLNCVTAPTNGPTTIGTAGTANTGCSAPTAIPQNFTAGNVNPGLYTLNMQAIDQAGNTSPVVTTQYYIDQTAPTMTGGIAIPAAITVGSSFTTSAADNMDLASAHATLRYNGVSSTAPAQAIQHIINPGTLSATGVAFDNVLTRAATATITLGSQFYRGLAAINAGVIGGAPVKPDSIEIRAVDAASNLSVADGASFPTTNVSTPVAFTVGTGNANSLQDFTVTDSGTATLHTIRNSTTKDETATLIATVTAPNLTSNTPFSQVCFYVFTPNGAEGGAANAVTGGATNDLALLGCTSTVVTTDSPIGAPTTRTFTYRFNYNPPQNATAGFGTSGTINVVAIGSNAAGDALMSPSLTLTLAP